MLDAKPKTKGSNMNRKREVEMVLENYRMGGGKRLEQAISDLDAIYGVMPDDGEQIDDIWLLEVGGSENGCYIQFAIDQSSQLSVVSPWAGKCYMVFFYHYGCSASDDEIGTAIASPSTRYQFRRLCEALGVELKERKDGE